MGFSLPRSLPLLRAGLFSDTDDAARLAQVRDLVGGQAWFDLSQHRLGLTGALMHWTRLWDAFLALPIVTLRGIIGESAAEMVAVVALPTFVLVGVLLLVGKIATHLAGEGAWLPAVVTSLVIPYTTTRLVPGAIDDHGFQYLLILVMIAGLIDRRPGWLATAGIAAGLSLVVGVDTLPIMAAVFVAIGAYWATGGLAAVEFRRFPAWVLGTAIVGGLVFAPPARLVSGSCLVLSLPFVVALAGVATTFWLVLPGSYRAPTRWALLSLGGLGAAAAGAVAAPACLQGVYADLPREANDAWLRYVGEIQPLDFGAGNRIVHLGIILAPLIGLLFAGIKLKRKYEWKWLLLSLVMATAFGLGLWQQREAASAALLAAPICGAAIWTASRRLTGDRLRSAFVILSPLLVSGTLLVFLGSQQSGTPSTTEPQATCRSPAVLDSLSGLQPSVVISDIDFGATLLIGTPHQIVAGPYGMDPAGIVLSHRVFTSTEEEASTLARNSGVDLIVDCHTAPLLRIWEAEGGLLADLRAGAVPAWLAVVIDQPGMTAYRVHPN